MTKIINLYGGPGSGKSTTAAGLFYFMKLQGLKVELVTEYAKSLVYTNRLTQLLDQQEYIFAKQNSSLHCLRDKVDWVITDSPLLLSCVYVNEDWPLVNTFRELVIGTYNTYDNVSFFLERPNSFQQYGRIHTLEESTKIDQQIRWWLDHTHSPYTEIGTKLESVNQILTTLFPE
jgi:ABC-type dipeptide/oligopeptide/nickel transport system ATPase subunit